MADNGHTSALSLRDAEQIVRRLMPALQEHGAWLHRIHTMLICRTAPADEDLEPDAHLRSDLGRWFRDEPNDYVRRHPEHAAATEHHRRIHAIARDLCKAVRDGTEIAPADYQAFVEAVGRLDGSMELLAKELWDLLRYIDPLTGMSTRFAMLPRLKQERERVRRTGYPCSICMVDLDLFKSINDTYGHQAGDAVLEAVSGYLLRSLRKYDHIYRYGGEEFVLVLPDTRPDAARPVVERLRKGLAGLAIQLPDGPLLRMTASFGIAPLAPDGSVRDSIEHADAAMYAAKEAGRNQVRVWHP
jgi:diguanylate cyclase (GGDEF)-like protein